MKCILQYLKGSLGFGLLYRRSMSPLTFQIYLMLTPTDAFSWVPKLYLGVPRNSICSVLCELQLSATCHPFLTIPTRHARHPIDLRPSTSNWITTLFVSYSPLVLRVQFFPYAHRLVEFFTTSIVAAPAIQHHL